MLKDGRMVCDACEKPITRYTEVPPDGWPSLHNLCSPCFDALRARSLPR